MTALPRLLAMIGVTMLMLCSPAMSLAQETPPKETPLDLFLLIGQSNMAGRGKVEAEDKVAPPNVWTLTKADEWAPAIDPIHFDKPAAAGVGLGRTFGITVAEAWEGRQIGLVPCAVGGTSIDQWKPGGKLYDEAVRRAKIAAQRGTFRGILWHQGEADSRPERIDGYPAKLEALTAALKKDLNLPDSTPLIVGQLGPFRAAKSKANNDFNAMIAQYAADHASTACVTSEGTESIGDDTHFDAASLRELGRRYAAAFLKLSPRPDEKK